MAKLPKRRRVDAQMTFDRALNDKLLPSRHQTTPVIGDFFEELTAVMMSCKRLLTDSTTDLSPDAMINENTVVESKASLAANFQYVLLLRQIRMYDAFVSNGGRVIYVFWKYDLGKGDDGKGYRRATHFKMQEDLRDALAASEKQCFIMPYRRVERLLIEREKKLTLDSETYPSFFRLYTTDVRSVRYSTTRVASGLEVYDRDIPDFEVQRVTRCKRVTDNPPWRKHYDERENDAGQELGDAYEDDIETAQQELDDDVPF